MTVLVKFGRRVPRNWFRRTASKMRGLMTFQENIWLIIDRSLTMAKRKASASTSNVDFIKQSYREPENLNYDLEWIEITIKGNPDEEEEEYQEAMSINKGLGKLFKKDLPTDNEFIKPFKTSRLTEEQLRKAYNAGYCNVENKSIAQKLLDLGIITYVEKITE